MVTIPAKNYGQDFALFQRVTVTSTSFPANAQIVCPFVPQGIKFLNEDTDNIVEYSFKGINVNGELHHTSLNKFLQFDNIRFCTIFFRLKASGTADVAVWMWGIP